jgi:hypothetical protein
MAVTLVAIVAVNNNITRRSNGKITVGSRFAQFSLTVFFRLA